MTAGDCPAERGSQTSTIGRANLDPLGTRGVEELIATISHELRTPLTAIKGCARTLLRHDASLDGATRRQLLEDIDGEASRLHRLVENLLELSRAGSGAAAFSTQPTALDVLIRRVVADLVPRAGDRRFRLSLAPRLPPAEIDAVRIEQVVRNLLDNALKYSPPHSMVDVSAVVAGDEIAVTVVDDGPGIPPEHVDRIFDRFYRLERPGYSASGAGLGLAICRRFVELHGGRITAETAPERGASLRFTVPIASRTAT